MLQCIANQKGGPALTEPRPRSSPMPERPVSLLRFAGEHQHERPARERETIMASDDRYERDRERERARGRDPEWRGDDSFGGGWGNQTSRPQRLGDRSRRPVDDPDYGQERYGGGLAGDAFGQEYGGAGEPSDRKSKR